MQAYDIKRAYFTSVELGKKEIISQSYIKTDDRGYKLFWELLSAIHKSYKET